MKLSRRQIDEIASVLSENLQETLSGRKVIRESADHEALVETVKDNATLNEIIRSEVNSTLDKLAAKVVPTILARAAKAQGVSLVPEDVSNAVDAHQDRVMEVSDDISEHVAELMKEYVGAVVRLTMESLSSDEFED